MTFPRTAKTPNDSPTFFAQHKDRYLRQLLIADIEAITNRRLLVFFSHPDIDAPISAKDHEGINELLSDLKEGEQFDLVIESYGGETDSADSIISTLQNAGSFRAIVPGQAKSNATLIALAATEIVMGPASEIGPIEPIINNMPATFYLSERLKNHEDLNYFVLSSRAEDARKHTTGLAESLLSKGMMRGKTAREISKTVEILCAYNDDELKHAKAKEFFSHAATINSQKAIGLGLKIHQLNLKDGLEEKLRLLHAIYAQDCRTFNYSKIFETRRVSNLYLAQRN